MCQSENSCSLELLSYHIGQFVFVIVVYEASVVKKV